MRIAHFSWEFPPVIWGGLGTFALEISQKQVSKGNNVTVFAWDSTNTQPKKEVIDGINIVRSYNTKFMNSLPYNIYRLHIWWRKGYKDVLKLFEKNHFDIVHCHDLASLPIGVKLKNEFGIKLVYDAHEIWGYMVSRDLSKIWAYYYWWFP